MTVEQIKNLAKVMLAFTQGKEIQTRFGSPVKVCGLGIDLH